jgi:hypothetical protein
MQLTLTCLVSLLLNRCLFLLTGILRYVCYSNIVAHEHVCIPETLLERLVTVSYNNAGTVAATLLRHVCIDISSVSVPKFPDVQR